MVTTSKLCALDCILQGWLRTAYRVNNVSFINYFVLCHVRTLHYDRFISLIHRSCFILNASLERALQLLFNLCGRQGWLNKLAC